MIGFKASVFPAGLAKVRTAAVFEGRPTGLGEVFAVRTVLRAGTLPAAPSDPDPCGNGRRVIEGGGLTASPPPAPGASSPPMSRPNSAAISSVSSTLPAPGAASPSAAPFRYWQPDPSRRPRADRNSNSGFRSSRAPTPYSTAATCLHIDAWSGQLHENRISDGFGNSPLPWRQIRSITPLEAALATVPPASRSRPSSRRRSTSSAPWPPRRC